MAVGWSKMAIYTAVSYYIMSRNIV